MLLLEGPQTYGHSLKDSILGTAFEDWDSQSLSKLIDLMVEVGADLNSSFVTREPYQHYQRYEETPLGTVVHTGSRAVTKRLLDAVVKRGDIKTTKRLLDAGALLTTIALSFAVESGNEILVRFLINQGADVSAECSVEDVGTPTQASTCPLAAAVRLQKESMVGIILVHMDTKALCSPHVFRSTWQAAVEVNSPEWIRRLLAVSAEMAPACLGYALDIAAEHGLRDVAFCLLDSGADVTNWARTPALLSALQQEDRVLVYALLERDAIQDRNRENFLEAALLWGDHDVILAVVSATLRVGDRLRESETATVAIFARRRNYRLMDVLIEAGLNINHHYPSREASLLTTAVKDNDIELVKFWLDRGAKDTDGSAFTHALGQSEEILELLMENLARSQPREWQLSGARALKAANDADKLTVFLKLLNRGANANARGTLYGFMRERNMMLSPFGHAVRAGPRKGIRFVERLLQDVLISNCTPESIVDSRILEVSRLCRREPESKQAIVAMTAMLEALRIKSYSMVSLMLRHGANINQPATNGVKRTPLQMATEVGSLDLVKLLLEKGADVDGLPALRNGASALQLAAAGGHFSIARLLLQKGASIDLPLPPFSLQPLEVAAYHGRLDMVALLLSTASYFYDPVKGPLKKQLRSATSLAKEEGYYYIVDMLKQYMRTGKVFVTQSKGTDFSTSTQNLSSSMMEWSLWATMRIQSSSPK